MAPQHTIITGASSGLGAALARTYAQPARLLSLCGRNSERLAEVAAVCRAAGADVAEAPLDVTDAAAMRAWLDRCADTAPLDLVIANAGISAGTGGREGGPGPRLEAERQAREILETNLTGVLNTVFPALDHARRHGSGHIAIVSSLAGYRGMPGAPAYCASKAAVKVWGESLRASLQGSGIDISVICPGFVRTPLTDRNPFPMPFLMSADRAAALIRRRLDRRAGRISFPWQLATLVWFIASLPDGLAHRLTRRLPEKPANG